MSADSEDAAWLQAKLKAAVEQEDYAVAAEVKALLDQMTTSDTLPPPPPPPAPSTADYTPARRGPIASISSAAAAADGGAVTSALEQDGVTRVDGVIPRGLATELLASINASLQSAIDDTRDAAIFDDQYYSKFGNVLSRRNRFDLKLSLKAQPVRAALRAVLETLQKPLALQLGDDAELYELAALVSLPGAARQPVHPDTPIVAGKGTTHGVTILTAFCALQDIEADMGPTLFLPATHTAEAHAAFFTYDNFELAFDSADDDDDDDGATGKEEDDELEAQRCAALLETWSAWRADLNTGDISLFDSRCLHAGAANASPRPRVLFYCSFIRAEHASAFRASDEQNPGTLLDDLRGEHTLGEWREWLGAS